MATLAVINRPSSRQSATNRAHTLQIAGPVLAEIGNRLVIGDQPTREPHHLNITPCLALKPPARLWYRLAFNSARL
jgi:hypothetical protein